MSRINLQPSYILKGSSYRETSMIYEVITANYGRVSLVHKGARTAKKNHVLQPFTPLLISWLGKGTLHMLTYAENTSHSLLEEPEKMIIGIYLNELLMHLVPKEVPSDEIFRLYNFTISNIASQVAVEKELRIFEIELLKLTGHGMQLKVTAQDGKPIEPDAYYLYELEKGPTATSSEPKAWNIVAGKTLLALAGDHEFDNTTYAESRKLMKRIIDYHIAPKKVNTRAIMKFLSNTESSLYGTK